jgi:hypothetical protein
MIVMECQLISCAPESTGKEPKRPMTSLVEQTQAENLWLLQTDQRAWSLYYEAVSFDRTSNHLVNLATCCIYSVS